MFSLSIKELLTIEKILVKSKIRLEGMLNNYADEEIKTMYVEELEEVEQALEKVRKLI